MSQRVASTLLALAFLKTDLPVGRRTAGMFCKDLPTEVLAAAVTAAAAAGGMGLLFFLEPEDPIEVTDEA